VNSSDVFRRWHKPVVGMVHLLPLPASPGHGDTVAAIRDRAIVEARTLADGGVDAILLQNTGDEPFTLRGGPTTVACMSVIGAAVAREVRCPIGVNVLANGSIEALAIAQAIGAVFVRIKVYCGAVVTTGGVVEGNASDALAFRRAIGASHIAIAADVYDRTSAPLADLPIEVMADLVHRHGRADALVVTGGSVDDSLGRIGDVKRAVPDAIVLAGGGTSSENVDRFLAEADGVIVGSSVKDTGRFAGTVDRSKLDAYMRAVVKARERASSGH
jgi:uncharacterized protein